MNLQSKIDAISILEKAFQHDANYRKKWTDYIEIVVTEQLESHNLKLKDLKKVRTKIAERIIDLFDADWWEVQTMPITKKTQPEHQRRTKRITGEDPTPRQFVESLLPKHYRVNEMSTGSILCESETGIDDDTRWDKFLAAVKEYFGSSFKEICHWTHYNHMYFTVYYDYCILNNMNYDGTLIKSVTEA